MRTNTNTFYQRLSFITLVAVYFLILVGGVVRATGSGMGCPDWPKCFGSWVPPTEVSQLPADYQQQYSDLRHAKNIRFSRYLSFFGFDELAEEILHDPSVREEAVFNASKTWVEYVNRLIGALVGFLILASFIATFYYRKSLPGLWPVALANLVLVMFQGWIGSIVVSTNLTAWMISVHMVLALVILLICIYLYLKTKPRTDEKVQPIGFVQIALLIALFIQIILGTQVREGVDMMARSMVERANWLEEIGLVFYIHRSFSWVILAIQVVLTYRLWKQTASLKGLGLTYWVLIAIVLEVVTGTIMAYTAIPAWIQPLHLFIGVLIFGLLSQGLMRKVQPISVE
ncbi:COX15/CtaA family protein [Cytophagales bacterium LB-30]|uniref:COX15/CtaA family protein n=1 Tax=Shiella aurantiaca TaxID=3058365 RepID=A0ABT8F3Z2_9BACT|nr:COX15/CtaA family protein [Shiella aurantiaca]MDN4165165.1 COX15/CtaA family protein [Shiella aurantiaca]